MDIGGAGSEMHTRWGNCNLERVIECPRRSTRTSHHTVPFFQIIAAIALRLPGAPVGRLPSCTRHQARATVEHASDGDNPESGSCNISTPN